MKQFLTLLLSFAPWIAFLAIAHGSLLRLKIGLVVAAVLSLGMGAARLHRGVILWVGMAFFAYAGIAVLVFEHMWTVRYLSALANGALALGVWLGMALKRPFTLEYAREQTDPALWNHPVFLRVNYVLTGAWAVVFTMSAALALQRSLQPVMPAWAYEAITYALLVAAVFLSSWYPEHIKRRAAAQSAWEG
ncbi:MAG: hypothetical protein KKA55_12795 [Proteobacteria bacterium]|nr:hypothetical protein [Pseudomonadota bacterium]MBU1596396.1 hypothetical protein [Pseudomonadota bacterium]